MMDFEKVQRNVQKMIELRAPGEDIDGYLESEGLTPDKFKEMVSAPPPDPANVAPPIDPLGENLQWDQPGYPRPSPPDTESYSGTILPFSRDSQGNTRFDSNVGIVGPVKRAINLPREVLEGKVNPTSPEGLRRALEMAAVATPMSAATRAGAGVMGGRSVMAERGYKQPERITPTRQALGKAKDEAFKRAEDLDIRYTPESVKKFSEDLIGQLNTQGSFAELKGVDDVHTLISKLQNVPADGDPYVMLGALKTFRERMGDYAISNERQVSRAATTAIKAIDEFLETPDASRLVGNTAAAAREAAENLKTGRGNAAALFRSDEITGLQKTQSRRTASANSGRNADNNIRQRLTSLIENKGKMRGFSDSEKTAIDDVIFGSRPKNAAREIGNRLGGGGGGMGTALSMMLGGGAYGADLGLPGILAGIAVPQVGGSTARGIANRMSRNELKALDDLIRQRSPLHQNTPTPAPVYQPGPTNAVVSAALKAALARAALEQRGPNGGYMIDGVEYF